MASSLFGFFPSFLVSAPVVLMASLMSPSVRFASSSGSIVEKNGTYAVKLTLSKASTKPVTVYFRSYGESANGSDQCGSRDYLEVDGSVTFSPGQTAKTLWLPIFDDADAESNETLQVYIWKVVGAKASSNYVHSVVIRDNDVPARLRIDDCNLDGEGLQQAIDDFYLAYGGGRIEFGACDFVIDTPSNPMLKLRENISYVGYGTTFVRGDATGRRRMLGRCWTSSRWTQAGGSWYKASPSTGTATGRTS